MPTEHNLRRMSPRARSNYIQVLISALESCESIALLAYGQRWCAFIANVGWETGA